MSIEEIKHSSKDMLTPADVAPILGCKPYSINLQARDDISKLGFPACLIGTTVKIPRLSFLHWLGYSQ